MYNKNKCKTCKYRTRLSKMGLVLCDYGSKSDNGTALKRCGNEVVDTRGNDPDNCLLYEKGRPIKVRPFFKI